MASEVNVAQAVQGISPEGFEALVQRTKNASRRMVNQGAGLFLLAIILTAVLAISLRVAIPRFISWESAVAGYVGLIFQSELETTPTRSIRPVIATITSIIESQKLLDCDTSAAQCPAVRAASLALNEVSRAEAEITELVLKHCKGKKLDQNCVGSSISAVEASIPHATSGISRTDLELLVKERIRSPNWQEGALDLVTNCSALLRAAVEKPTGRSTLLPSAGCDAAASTNGTTTIIPQQLANTVGSRDTKYSDRVLAALVESRTFDHVVAAINAATSHQCSGVLIQGGLCSPDSEETITDKNMLVEKRAPNYSPDNAVAGQLVQAYFISLDSILRIWSPQIEEEQFPGNRLWSQGPYAFRLLNSDKPSSTTGIYVDTGGNGLVRTYCYPVEAPAASNRAIALPSDQETGQDHPNIAANKIFEGEICVDVALRARSVEFRQLIRTLKRNPMVDSDILSIHLSGSGRVEEVSLMDGQPLPPEILGLPSAELISRVLERAEVGHYVTDHWIAGVPVVLMPVARESDGKVLELILKPKGLSPPASLVASGSLACLSLLGTGITLFLLGASRRESELDSQIGRLRSLPIGVLETDLMHNVIAANDRAEEMVNRRLPKIGVLDDAPAVKFDDLFDSRDLYGIEFDSSDPSGVTLTTVTEEQLRERRLAGARSEYYARLKTQGQAETWLRLVAIPLLPLGAVRADSATNSLDPKCWMPAFGVLLECSRDDINAINRKRSLVDQSVSGVGDG